MRPDSWSRRVFALAIARAVAVVIIGSGAARASASDAKHTIKPYALIFGTVWDARNQAAPGVKIRIRRESDKKPKWELISDRRGEFAQRVPAQKADYVVWAEVKGKKGRLAETKVHIENDERQDIGLHLPE
jgi:hypothetical protein